MDGFCFYIEYIQTTLTTHILVLKTQIETYFIKCVKIECIRRQFFSLDIHKNAPTK